MTRPLFKALGALLLAMLASLWAVPAAATQMLLPHACLLVTEHPLSYDDAREATGWNCNPTAEDTAFDHVWLRVEGDRIAPGEDLLLRTDSLGFGQLTTVTELADGRQRMLGYGGEGLGQYWTLGTRIAVPLLYAGERADRVWVRIDKPLDRNTATLASIVTVADDDVQKLYGMAAFALFVGMLLVVVIYSLSLSITLRSGFALWHGLLVSLFLGYTVCASSLVFMVLPDLTLWQRSAGSYLLLALSMSLVTPFFLTFLEPFALPRWARRTMIGASLLIAAGGIGFVLLAHQLPFLARPLYHASFIPALLSFAIFCPLAWYRGSKTIGMVALAWSMPVLVGIDRTARGLNLYVLPTEWDFAFYASMAWQAVVMAAAITWRIGQIRSERDLARAQEQALGELALTDGLTGVPNRRAFDTREWREGDYLAIIDADHFKRINDRLGHQAGDEVLRAIGGHLARVVAEPGPFLAAFRLGGEEFAVLVKAQSSDEAALAVNRLRHELGATVQSAVAVMAEPLSLSGGLARIGADGVVAAYRAADRALYKAKNSGRDLLCYETGEAQGSAMIFPRRQAAA
ncbi:GGDEF domain-containing protein [Altererythrobacter sp. KTW20L]|uniref:GGDEF domain-containing protein n=1 Tax=Altererythrobacter sp. KTW20L TaxID=2942210 RepID=UPI0020BFF3A4|nr:diguanylate cyclase [Altererythrobacter sp. KTW20L]MCL6249757.1 GGDEF domain-containing protein [Altererythrobacter sp. KTW20L]